jgi:hypothetical protein
MPAPGAALLVRGPLPVVSRVLTGSGVFCRTPTSPWGLCSALVLSHRHFGCRGRAELKGLKGRDHSHSERWTRARRAARGQAEGLTLGTLARGAAPFLTAPVGVV